MAAHTLKTGVDGKTTMNQLNHTVPHVVTTQYSRHAEHRQRQRNLSAADVAYVLNHGELIRRTGATFMFLGKQDIPWEDRRHDQFARLAGTTILLGDAETIITLYRNPRALRDIKRKDKHRRQSRQGIHQG
jgi:hypothetical protein